MRTCQPISRCEDKFLLSVLQPWKQVRESRGEERSEPVYLLTSNIALHKLGHCDGIQDSLPQFLDIW
jgi:hypothetical protein